MTSSLVGSEMCIRDRVSGVSGVSVRVRARVRVWVRVWVQVLRASKSQAAPFPDVESTACLSQEVELRER
eukprot:7947941-Prorocentrum_lima.AAC.1